MTIHISQRAMEWLTRSTVYSGVGSHWYKSSVGIRACAPPPPQIGVDLGRLDPVDPKVMDEWEKAYDRWMTESQAGQPVCGTEDMRALYLNHVSPNVGALKVVYKPGTVAWNLNGHAVKTPQHYVSGPIIKPTCQECIALWSAAMEKGVPDKHGDFLHASRGHGYRVYWARFDDNGANIRLRRPA